MPNPHLCGFPDATNTGPSPGTFTVEGDLDASVAGMLYDHVQVNGCVTVSAPNVTFRNSKLLGDCFLVVKNNSTGLVIDKSEISCNGGSGSGITANNYTVMRSNVHNCENGLDISGNGDVAVRISDNWIHDLTFIAGQSHSDGIQIGQGSTNISISHNTINACSDCNSAIIMWDEGNPQNKNVSISGNLAAGGRFPYYCNRMNSTGNTVNNNRIVQSWSTAYTNGCTPGHVSFTNNRDDVTNAVIAPA